MVWLAVEVAVLEGQVSWAAWAAREARGRPGSEVVREVAVPWAAALLVAASSASEAKPAREAAPVSPVAHSVGARLAANAVAGLREAVKA